MYEYRFALLLLSLTLALGVVASLVTCGGAGCVPTVAGGGGTVAAAGVDAGHYVSIIVTGYDAGQNPGY
jgi:hypothetical protein